MNNTDLLNFENDKLLNYKSKEGVPFWFYIRDYYFRECLTRYVLNVKTIPTSMKQRKFSAKALSFFLKAVFVNIQKRKLFKRKIVFYSEIRRSVIDGLYYNQYCEAFADIFPDDSVIIENVPVDWEWYFPRKNNNVVFFGPNRIVSEIRGIVGSHFFHEKVSDFLSFIKERTKELYSIELPEQEMENIRRIIDHRIIQIQSQSKWIEKKIKKNCKVFICMGASYARNFVINQALKKHGIKVYDLQHGLYTNNNLMYNLGSGILANKLVQDGLPTGLLTYGRWWSSQVNMPYSEKIEVGNPFRSIQKGRINSNISKKIILLVGCCHCTEQYIDLANKLNELIGQQYIIRFRPHPSEFRYVDDYIQKSNANGELIDHSDDLYLLLSGCKAVISEISTVLFEAIGIADMVIVWKTKYSIDNLGKSPFINGTDAEEMVKLIQQTDTMYLPNDFWREDWREAYKTLIHEKI